MKHSISVKMVLIGCALVMAGVSLAMTQPPPKPTPKPTKATPKPKKSTPKSKTTPLPKKKTQTVTLDEKASGKKQVLRVGDTLIIRLRAQMGTGYSWEVTAIDKAFITQEGEPIVETVKQSLGAPVVGSSEVQVFRFKAIKLGKTTLTLRYKRPFGEATPDEKNFTVPLVLQ
jgi:predicted secreted protein